MANTFSLAGVDKRSELEAAVGALQGYSKHCGLLHMNGKYVAGSARALVVSGALRHVDKLESWIASVHRTRVVSSASLLAGCLKLSEVRERSLRQANTN